MNYIAVIDTETNWYNELMSIGIVIASPENYEIIDRKYYVITPAYLKDGMYSSALFIDGINVNRICSRKDMLEELYKFSKEFNVKEIFAYNANFDYNILPELSNYIWKDIMSIAAYKQYNKKIPEDSECFKTGRLKRCYGVEPIYRLLSNKCRYHEKHNALCDAIDELCIMKMLEYDKDSYKQIKNNCY